MTLQRVKGKVAFSCDSCSETFEAEANGVSDAWSEAKEEGWTSFSTRSGFTHQCPSCSEGT